MLKAFLIEELSELKTKKQKLELPSADLEVQLVQLNHCDGVYLLKYLIKKLKETLAIHQVLCLDPPLITSLNRILSLVRFISSHSAYCCVVYNERKLFIAIFVRGMSRILASSNGKKNLSTSQSL